MGPPSRVEARFRQPNFAPLLFALLVLVPCPSALAARTQSGTPSSIDVSGLHPRKHLIKPVRSVVRPGYDPLRIEVKFQDGLEPEIDGTGKLAGSPGFALGSSRAATALQRISFAGGRWRRASSMDPDFLRQLRTRAQLALGREIADLSSYCVLTLPPGADPEGVMNSLNALPEVELAAPATVPVPPPSVPDFEPLQRYLTPAPDGHDSHFAWTIPGGTGAGVAICDMEGGWNLNHEDLPPATVMIPSGESLASVPVDDHGTEVLGTMFSLPNRWGTTGASYDARCLVAPDRLDSGYGLFQQILWAASQLEAGDVILLEEQTSGPYYSADGTSVGYVPIEWEPSIYNAILTAVGNGIHVVEPAGNGSQNLDDPIYAAGNFGHAPFLPENNSGAIMVGAGIPPTAPELGPDRARSVFSNFGSRLDVQSWGHRVVTTGSGDLYSEEGPNRSFTRFFGGTSSAGPLVASAVASIEGIAEHGGRPAVPPSIMRSLLIETGTPQQDGTRPASQEPIGPRPDLRSAIQRMTTPIVSAPTAILAFEGESVHFTVYAADLDGQCINALTAGPLPSGASFTASAGNSQGNFEWDTHLGQAGAYILTFTASNTAEASDTTRIEVGSAERGPVISGPGGALGLEGGSIEITLHAMDPNGDPIVSFSAENLPRGAAFVADSSNNSGVFTWTPDYDQAGYYVVSFAAASLSNGHGGQEEIGNGLLVLTILNGDRQPVVLAPDSVSGADGELLSFTITAEDPDGDAITVLRADPLPPGALFEPGASNLTGTFTWTPTFGQPGYYSYPVDFFAENASTGFARTLITISNTGQPPVVSAPLAARAYVLSSENPIRLGSGGPTACVQLEPVDGDFDLGRVDPTTVNLALAGAGSTDRIQAQAMGSATPSDRDNNGITDLSACFSKDDLRRLFESIRGDRQRVHATISGELLGGGTFEGVVDIDIVPQRGLRDATVTPNPSRKSPVLSFYTSKPAPVRLGIFDVRGRLIFTAPGASQFGPGFHDITLSAASKTLTTGIYYYKLDTCDGSTTGRFIILK